MFDVVDYRNFYEFSTGNWRWRDLRPGQGFYPPKKAGDLSTWRNRACKAGHNGRKAFRAKVMNGDIFVCRII